MQGIIEIGYDDKVTTINGRYVSAITTKLNDDKEPLELSIVEREHGPSGGWKVRMHETGLEYIEYHPNSHGLKEAYSEARTGLTIRRFNKRLQEVRNARNI